MSDYGNSFGKSVRLPKLRAHYKVVRMESDAIDVEGQIVCRRCGAPFKDAKANMSSNTSL